MKKFIFYSLLISIFAFLIFSCEKDEIITSNESLSTKHLNYSLKRISYVELVADQEFSGSLKAVQTNLFGTELTQKNSGDVNKIDLSILTEEIIKIETEEVTTWTFELGEELVEGSDFENLMVKKYNEEFSYFLIAYKNKSDEDKTIEESVLYPIPEEYLDTEVIDIHLKSSDALDWAPPVDGGGDGPCNGEIYTEIEPCDKGGYHEPTYACQHYGGIHGMSDFPPCDEVCSGTNIVTIIDFSGCNNGTDDPPSGPSNDLPPGDNPNDGQHGGGGTTPTDDSTSEPTYTAPLNENGTSAEADFLINSLNLTNQIQIDWVKAPENSLEISEMQNFIYQNGNTQEAKDFVESAIDILATPELSPDDTQENLTAAILKMTTHLREKGNPEDELFAEYIESIVPDFLSMTRGDVYDIYKLTRQQVHNLTKKYLEAVIVPFAEAAYPFVVYALTEATLGAALPLLSRIPLAMVIRGTRLNKMVQQVGLLGVRGSSNNIRIITTSSPITKSKELFNSLTKHAISKVTDSNGAIVANMGNGNFITYRTITQSGSNFPATINLDFVNIWANPRILKFQ